MHGHTTWAIYHLIASDLLFTQAFIRATTFHLIRYYTFLRFPNVSSSTFLSWHVSCASSLLSLLLYLPGFSKLFESSSLWISYLKLCVHLPQYRYSLYDIHCTVFTVRDIHSGTIFTVRYSLYDIHVTIFTVRYSLYDIHCTIFTVQYSLYDIHCTIYPLDDIHFTIVTVRYSLHDIHFTIYSLYDIFTLRYSLYDIFTLWHIHVTIFTVRYIHFTIVTLR